LNHVKRLNVWVGCMF